MDGELKNCPYCNRVYLDLGEGCCLECKVKREEQRQVVRDYLFEHADADLVSIARGTGLSLRTLIRMRKEGFLEKNRTIHTHTCKRCGTHIDDGLYCTQCVAAFARKRVELANRRMLDSLQGLRGGRREADTKFLSKTYVKFVDPLVKVTGRRRRRNFEGILREYEEQYGERRR